MKIVNILRHYFFNFTIMAIPLPLVILLFPILLFKKFRLRAAIWVGCIWIRWIKLMLRLICLITIEVRGSKNIPHTPFIIASKHQSAIDTFFIFEYFKGPVFVFKKDLLKIPVFGIYLQAAALLPINRDHGIEALRKLIKVFSQNLNNGRSVVIFPEGTRAEPFEVTKVKPGIVAIHNNNPGIPILPIATNSGKFWGKKNSKIPGKIVFEILKPIDTKLSKQQLIKQLEHDLGYNSNQLCQKG